MNFFKIQNRYLDLKHRVYTRLVRSSFGSIGKGCTVQATMRCTNPRDIHLGNNIFIGADAWIDCFSSYADVPFTPRLEIGDDTMIGYHSHIMVFGHMKIGRDVLIADKVYISDNLHGYEDTKATILSQNIIHRPVTIEDRVWIGENVAVLPGVTVGMHSVIGSNSVVTHDVPPFSVAVGVPAKVIRYYDMNRREWVKPPHKVSNLNA